ncbi:MAG: peptidylprolyl isomerase SurA [Gammaproteobacteria bacterium]|nr:MAG: peptidylprolyl isomerase SurA [Gammaproteobacteria bacterium]
MKKTTLFLNLIITSSLLLSSSLIAKEVPLDRVAVVVNNGVVLESEINDLVKTVKIKAKKENQSLPSDKALRVQATDKLINDSLLLQLGERMGVQVSDAQLDETITNMAKENNLTIEQFRQTIVDDGLDYEKYRENIRGEIISGEVRRASLSRRIYIPPQEIKNLLEVMKKQTNMNTEYHLGHILIVFPADPTQKDIVDAKTRADKVIELLKNGSNFAKIAIASSSDANALKGGDFGWKTINEMPTLFAELVDGKAKDTILGPIRTGLGYSIVKVIDIRGKKVVEIEEVNARHILIKPTIILSDAKAKAKLQGFLDDIKAGKAKFADLAKEYSEGPTSVKGGELGWTDPNNYDPAFKDALAKLKIDEYSEPFKSSFGWHIAQLEGRRMLDATQQMDQKRAYQMLYRRKFTTENYRWMKETRDEAHIEILGQDN